ncbi:hypothetical protein H072_10322 [Dactylellina haptotyla CBS 200.50]|uniref:Uncharacterized protein n=1 Tax=Dactylellina haptotyla (strain CBS 200.50) TaxID=1284197 RepID=S8A541_DACHA|nr:hypothetical protein H072_10322 [Dactylellina haptotyla CBS 200.50]
MAIERQRGPARNQPTQRQTDRQRPYRATRRLDKRVDKKRPGDLNEDDQPPRVRQKVDPYSASINRGRDGDRLDVVDRFPAGSQNDQQRQDTVLKNFGKDAKPVPNGFSDIEDEVHGSLKVLNLADKIIKTSKSYQPVHLINLARGDGIENDDIALITYISWTNNHMIIRWGGYFGAVGDMESPEYLDQIPDMLYTCWSTAPKDQINKLGYISIFDIPDYSEIWNVLKNIDKREFWDAFKGTREIGAVFKMLHIYWRSLGAVQLNAVHISFHDKPSIMPGFISGTETVIISLELRAPEKKAGSLPGPSSINLDDIYGKALAIGKERWANTEKEMSTWSQPNLIDPPISSLQMDGEFFFDFSWNPGQTYPFESFLQSFDYKGPWGYAETTRTTRASWKKTNVVKYLPGGNVETLFRASASAEDKHFSFWWDNELLVPGRLVDWIYQCWILGSNQYSMDEYFSGAPVLKSPAANLKFITIWNIQNLKTVMVLQEVYSKSSGVSKGSDPPVKIEYKLIEVLSDSTLLDSWQALIGTDEIGAINTICNLYPVGLAKAKIAKIGFKMHISLSNSNILQSASVLIELESDTPIEPKGSPKMEIGYDGSGIPFAAQRPLDILLTSHEIVQNPLMEILKSKIDYLPSQKPSYVRISAIDFTSDEHKTVHKYIFQLAMSSDERHLVLESIRAERREAPDGETVTDLPADDILYATLGEVFVSAWVSQKGLSTISDVTFGEVSSAGQTLIKSHMDPETGHGGSDSTGVVTRRNDGSDEWKAFLNAFYESTIEGNAIRRLNGQHDIITQQQLELVHMGNYVQDNSEKFFILVRFRKRPTTSLEILAPFNLVNGGDALGSMGTDASTPLSIGWDGRSEDSDVRMGHDDLGTLLPVDPGQLLELAFWRGTRTKSVNLVTQAEAKNWLHFTDAESMANYFHDPTENNALIAKYDFKSLPAISNPNNEFISKAREKFNVFNPGRSRLSTFRGPHLRFKVKLHTGSNYEYDFAIQVSHIVVFEINGPAEQENLLASLADAMYATWAKIAATTQISASAYRDRLFGIRYISLLSFGAESRRILSHIYRDNQDLLDQEGYLNLEGFSHLSKFDEVEILAAGIYSRDENIRKAKLQLILLGLPEIFAINNIFMRYSKAMDQTKNLPRAIDSITVRWVTPTDETETGKLPDMKAEVLIEMAGFLFKKADASMELWNSNWRQSRLLSENLKSSQLLGGAPRRYFNDNFLDSRLYTLAQGPTEGEAAFFERLFTKRVVSGITDFWAYGETSKLAKTLSRDKSDVFDRIQISRRDIDQKFEVLVGRKLRHIVLSQSPRNIRINGDPSNHVTSSSEAITELSKILLEAWRYFPEALQMVPASINGDDTRLIVLENLGEETLEMINYAWQYILRKQQVPYLAVGPIQFTTELRSILQIYTSASPVPTPPLINGIPQVPMELSVTYDSIGGQGPLLGKSINAAEGALWIGKDTSSSCPIGDQLDCPDGNITAIRLWQSTTITMSVAVTGGQQFYIAPNGLASYTEARYYNIPSGSIADRFVVNHSNHGGLLPGNSKTGGWKACPIDDIDNGPWKVFLGPTNSDVPTGNIQDCRSIFVECRASEDEPHAYEYD